MPEVTLSAGPIEYEDTGGDGPVLVFLHGLLMDGSLWRKVVPQLDPDWRCVLPTLPLGGHRRPMRADADLSLAAQARLVGEFLERLELRDVTLVQNDWGGAQILLAQGGGERIGRLVITSSEAFDNYPPRIARFLVPLAKVPGGLAVLGQLLRLRPVRRAPRGWGWMSKRPVPKDVMDSWFRPVRTSRDIRRDLAKYVVSVPARAVLLDWAARAASFDRPVLVAWAGEDRVMPPEHGRRLAALFPDARLVEIADSYTLIPEDQPDVLAGHVRNFVADTAELPRSG
ncbi:MAG TPA: alpha/beta hydrolase [Mycobacteriales bacterium]